METWIKIIVGAITEAMGIFAKTLIICGTIHWFLEREGLLALIVKHLK